MSDIGRATIEVTYHGDRFKMEMDIREWETRNHFCEGQDPDFPWIKAQEPSGEITISLTGRIIRPTK
jgi:hypothetical protein